MDIKDAWNNDVTIGDVVLWRTKKGFRKGKIEKIYIEANWRGGIRKSFIVSPEGSFGSSHAVKVFIKAT